MQKYIKETNFENDTEVSDLLIKNCVLNRLFCQNFVKYYNLAREKQKTVSQDFDSLLIDNFTHSQNIKARMDFLYCLISNNRWQMEEGPIDFLFNIIYCNALDDKDKNEFYRFVQKKMENDNSTELMEKVFNIFTQRICKDRKSCQNLSFQAFESYLKVFLDLNQRKNALKFNFSKSKDNYEITSFSKDPERLEGFDSLWQIIFESFSDEIMNKGIEILHTLYTVIKLIDKMIL